MKKDKVAILVKEASLECDKIAYPILIKFKLTFVQYKIIKYIYRMGSDNVRQIDIEKYFSLTNPTVTGILQNLERDGWIKRVINPNDARSKIICLLPKSLDKMDELIEAGIEIEKNLVNNLTNKERERLISLLKKLLKIEDWNFAI